MFAHRVQIQSSVGQSVCLALRCANFTRLDDGLARVGALLARPRSLHIRSQSKTYDHNDPLMIAMTNHYHVNDISLQCQWHIMTVSWLCKTMLYRGDVHLLSSDRFCYVILSRILLSLWAEPPGIRVSLSVPCSHLPKHSALICRLASCVWPGF